MNLNALQQAARALIGASKDVSLRANPPAAAPAIEPITPAREAAQAPSAVITSGGAAAQALNSQVAARGSMLATVVTALGGSRYLINVDGADTPVVLNTAALRGTEQFTPGTVVRLVPAATPAEAAPASGTPATALSEAGRLLANTAGEDGALDPRTPLDPAIIAPSLSGALPLSAPVTPEQLARFIAQIVTDSGLFYESHLADWVIGQRQLGDLQGEPQLRWPAGQAAAPANDASSSTAMKLPASSTSPVSPNPASLKVTSPHALAPGATSPSTPLPSTATAEAAWQAATPDARAMVREQLQALSSQWIAWRGQLWPGQQGAIQIGRDPVATQGAAPETWRAQLAVTLPTLGRVEVGLAMNGIRLDLTIAGDSEAHVSRLAAESNVLLKHLQAQGMVPLARFLTAPTESPPQAQPGAIREAAQ
jgi:hypothetical protein